MDSVGAPGWIPTVDSLRNLPAKPFYFGLGFIKLRLDETRRLHFYTPDLPAITDPEEAHNHRYGFLSRILRGSLTNRLLTVEPGDSHLLTNESCDPNVKAPPRQELVRLVPQASNTYEAGQSYVMTDSMLHQVETDRAITLVTRTQMTRDFAEVVRPVNGKPVCPFSQTIPEDHLWEVIDEMLRAMPPFTITEDRVAFHGSLDIERTEAFDKELRALVTRGVPITIDLSGARYVDTPWIRLITTLTIEEGADITIVGADKGTLDTVRYLGHAKHWKLANQA